MFGMKINSMVLKVGTEFNLLAVRLNMNVWPWNEKYYNFFQLEKDLVIGELTTRMRGNRPPSSTRAGFNKNRRGNLIDGNH